MINAIMFDLDGTLVQSEKLKAESYAIAVQRLRGLDRPDVRAITAYQATVGASREVASQFLIDHELTRYFPAGPHRGLIDRYCPSVWPVQSSQALDGDGVGLGLQLFGLDQGSVQVEHDGRYHDTP